MKTAAYMGMPLSELNNITPREFFLYIDGFNTRKELEQKESIYQAYLISRWVWAKKIDIAKALGRKKENKTMTDEQMLEQARVLNMLFGREVMSNG